MQGIRVITVVAEVELRKIWIKNKLFVVIVLGVEEDKFRDKVTVAKIIYYAWIRKKTKNKHRNRN